MRTVTDLRALQRGRPIILTMGTFDGVHRGHQYLLRQVVGRARALDFDSMVISFDPAPVVVFRPGSKQLSDRFERERIIGALGVDNLAVVPFSRELAEVPAGQFLLTILEHAGVSEIWEGGDFAFGHNREGDLPFLIRAGQESGFGLHVVPRQALDGAPISSTRVRELIERGDVAAAARLLGHYFGFGGRVIGGHGRGMGLGYPTANVEVSPYQQLPAPGIYAAFARHADRRLEAAVYVGYAPVFEGDALRVEAYLLDFEGDLRGQRLDLEFVDRVRGDANFDNVEALVAQMEHDVVQVRTALAGASEPGELILSP